MAIEIVIRYKNSEKFPNADDKFIVFLSEGLHAATGIIEDAAIQAKEGKKPEIKTVLLHFS